MRIPDLVRLSPVPEVSQCNSYELSYARILLISLINAERLFWVFSGDHEKCLNLLQIIRQRAGVNAAHLIFPYLRNG